MMWGNDGFCPWCGNYLGGGIGLWELLLLGFFGLLVVVGIVLLIVWVVRQSGGGQSAGGTQPPTAAADDGERIARERYARGEITKDEYDEIVRTLKGG